MQTSDSNGVGAPFYLTALHNNSVEHTMSSTCVQLDFILHIFQSKVKFHWQVLLQNSKILTKYGKYLYAHQVTIVCI